MDIQEIARSLHPLERKIIHFLKHHSRSSEIIEKAKMLDVEVVHALQWLEQKGALALKEESTEYLSLGENGKKAAKHGLPETAFLKAIKEHKKTKDELIKHGLTVEEVNACIGLLRQKNAMTVSEGPTFTITDAGKKLLEKDAGEEMFLRRLTQGSVKSADLDIHERAIVDALKKRKNMLETSIKKDWHIDLSSVGKELLKLNFEKELVEKLTPEMLATGSWKGKEFRSYDINAVVPKRARGKRHFLNQAKSSAKQIWLDMGFKEMTGTYVNTSFWNFDALFTAQDHPVREMQDTFFIKLPAKGFLPDKKIVDKVKSAHENGGGTGSTGWKYKWSEEEAKKNVLRTHTTVLSAQTLASISKEDLPVKYFALGKCFRNETLDWSHLFEFNQTEGIVVDENANFRHLLGYLKAFFKKMGYEKARFRPAYFPYTEFSVEIDVFHPVHNKWFELGGSGIFRPEVVKPLLGIDVPVLAWGPGFDRIIIEYYKIADIRDLYRNDLKQLREMKEWMR
jgi:phenylalanyl-tRNA synthetase alpha chain